jgi:hypothetical protein
LTDIATIVGVVGGALGGTGTLMAYLLTRGTVQQDKSTSAVKGLVHTEIEPLLLHRTSVDGQIAALAGQLGQLSADLAKMHDRQGTVLDRITVLETKIDVFWKNVALDVARVLHSPNPARAHIDELLEAFMDGHLEPAQRANLKTILTEIRDYHQGDPSAFPIYPGDQVAAAILLQTMDLASTGGRR